MVEQPCPTCGGQAAQAGEPGGAGRTGTSIGDVVDLPVGRRARVLRGHPAPGRGRARASIPTSPARSSRKSATGCASSATSGSTTSRSAAAPASLSGGEAQRIRLATQIGSRLVGVLYILDEPSIGLHQRDNERLLGTLRGLRDLGNTVHRGGARRGHHPRRRPRDRPRARAPGASAARWWRRGRSTTILAPPDLAHRRATSGDELRIPVPAGAARGASPAAAPRSSAPAPTTCANLTVDIPLGLFVAVTGVSGSGKSTPGHRHPLPGAGAALLPRAGGARRARPDRGARPDRQGHRHRPEPDRAHAALQPRHLHRALHADPRAVHPAARGEDARLRPGPLLLQREGRALRGVPGRRAGEDRDALPARRLRALRGVQGPAVQPRDARGALQGAEHRRRARPDGGGRARLLRAASGASPRSSSCSTTSGWATSTSARRPPRSPAARRSGSSSPPSSPSATPAARCTSSTSRPPGSTSRTCGCCSRCCTGWWTRATAWS